MGGAVSVEAVFVSRSSVLVKQAARGCLQECMGCEARSEYKISAMDHTLDRLQRIAEHIVAAPAQRGLLKAPPTAAAMSSAETSEDDRVFCCAVRTAITRANRGGFKDTPCEVVLVPLFRAVLECTKVDPKTIGDIGEAAVSWRFHAL